MESINNISRLSFLNTFLCKYRPGKVMDYSSLARPFHIIGYMQKGEATISGATGTIHLRPGDCFFIPLGETYISRWSEAEESSILCVFFYFEYENNPLEGKKYPMQKIENDAPSKIRILLDRLDEAIKDTAVFPAMQFFYELVAFVFARLSYVETPKLSSPVHNALHYLHIHFAEPVSIRHLADICFLSESRFMHVFKSVTGMSAIAYKNKLAIRHASRLLLSPEKSIEEISEECGYSSSVYFRRVFRETTGLSPREYRKKNAI
ncbi:MAG: AraC family transcriptional regulator [Ruminococcaceae bacterium]|nr:AraC family transcriptional regulator [Oscillospiraceae bacterium]